MNSDDRITIRQALVEDASIVHSMVLQLAESTVDRSKVTSRASDFAAAMSGDNPAIHVLIAERGGRPIGITILFLTFSTWRGTRGVYVQDIFVAPDARGGGLGKKMLAAAAKWAASQGADHLRLSVDRDNAAAQSFYAAIGLTYRDDEMMYQISGEALDALEDAE